MGKIRARMSKEEMRHLNFISSLPYPELVIAHKIIDRGPDTALLYFWFNLFKGHYFPLFSLDDVQKVAEYFSKKYPDWKESINTWFHDYQTTYAPYYSTQKRNAVGDSRQTISS
jgi:hypothetical protein